MARGTHDNNTFRHDDALKLHSNGKLNEGSFNVLVV